MPSTFTEAQKVDNRNAKGTTLKMELYGFLGYLIFLMT
jgi:hypothetical protein